MFIVICPFDHASFGSCTPLCAGRMTYPRFFCKNQ